MKFRQPLTDSDYLSVRCSLHVFERDMIVLIKSGTFTVSSAISMSPCQSLLLSVGDARARDARLTCIFRGIVSDNFLGWPDFVEIHVGIQTTKSVLGRHLAGTSPPAAPGRTWTCYGATYATCLPPMPVAKWLGFPARRFASQCECTGANS